MPIESSSFTIEFRVVCRKHRELEIVAWTLFHSLVANNCRVIGTSGSAEADGGAYPNPLKR